MTRSKTNSGRVRAIFLTVILLVFPTLSAQAVVLVSNIGQTIATDSAESPSDYELAQGFRAGSHAALSSIAIKLGGSFGGAAAPTMTLHRGSPESAAIATLSSPGWVGNGTRDYTYTAPANTVLAASTNYFIVIKGSTGFVVSKETASNSEDSGGENGWSVADDRSLRTVGGTEAFTQVAGTYPSLMIRVNGVVDYPPEYSIDVWNTDFLETVGSNTATASPVGQPIVAMDSDDDTLTYTLSGTDAAKFDIDAATGQLLTKDGEKYDRETKDRYSVIVTATDSAGQTDTVEVVIMVGDEDELPLLPGTPVVTQSQTNSADLVVSWTMPDNEGRPPITDYFVIYVERDTGLGGATVKTSDLTITLTNLKAFTDYQVQVYAFNDDGRGPRSDSAFATTGPGGRCVTPTLTDRSAIYKAKLTTEEYSRTYSGIGKEVYGYGFLDSVGALAHRAFVSSSTDYKVKSAFLFDSFAAGELAFLGYAADSLVLTLDRPLSEDDKDDLRLHVCSTTFNFSDSTRRDYGSNDVDYVWESSELDWSAPEIRYLYISRAASEMSRSTRDETVTDDSPPENSLIASFSQVPAEHDGASKFFVNFHLNEEPDSLDNRTVRDGLFDVAGGKITRAKRLTRGKNNGWHIDIVPSGLDDVTLQVRPTTACDAAPGVCTADGRKLPGGLQIDVAGPVTLSVADVTVREGDATLDFVVTLSRARSTWTSVQYATGDGTAYADHDYVTTFGMLVFDPMETTKTASVAVINDSHNEGSETMELTLSSPNPSTVKLADATATGTINNTGLIPAAWISRFGRTVAEQVIDAIDIRLSSKPEPGAELSFIGNRINLDGSSNDEAFANLLTNEEITTNNFLTSTSFMYTSNNGHSDGSVSIWVRGSSSSFDGKEDNTSVDGDVLSGMIGADWTSVNTLLGISVGKSNGDGAYQSAFGDGNIKADLTGIYPYWRHEISERISAWGIMGYGSGKLTVTPDNHPSIETDTSLILGAVGLRGIAKEALNGEGIELAITSYAMKVRTSSDATRGLESAKTAVSRVRIGLESTWYSHPIIPSLEIGARHDGGDAETGFGVDIGAGLAFDVPDSRLSFDLTARTLINHESDGFKNRNISTSLSFDPKPVFDSRFNGAPHIGLVMTEDSQDWRVDYRLDLAKNRNSDLFVGFGFTEIGSDDQAIMARMGFSW